MPVRMQQQEPLSRQSRTNSSALAVEEQDSRKRSLSLCSISEHMSGGLNNDQKSSNNEKIQNQEIKHRHQDQLL